MNTNIFLRSSGGCMTSASSYLIIKSNTSQTSSSSNLLDVMRSPQTVISRITYAMRPKFVVVGITEMSQSSKFSYHMIAAQIALGTGALVALRSYSRRPKQVVEWFQYDITHPTTTDIHRHTLGNFHSPQHILPKPPT
jgi:hypothetical protein